MFRNVRKMLGVAICPSTNTIGFSRPSRMRASRKKLPSTSAKHTRVITWKPPTVNGPTARCDALQQVAAATRRGARPAAGTLPAIATYHAT